MKVYKHILPQSEDVLRLERIETRRKILERLSGVTAFAASVWMIIFGVLLWTVVDFDYSWSPLKWLGPIGFAILAPGVMIGRNKRKLHLKIEEIRNRTSTFVLNKKELSDLKPELQQLTSDALKCCDTTEQALEVLAAYRAAALELMLVDASTDDATQHETLRSFEEFRNELRRVHDEVRGAHERKLM